MCGIVGTVDLAAATDADTLASIASRMAAGVAHRGPDDGGVWTDARAGVALGHRRLSVVDPTPLGHQPMVSADGRHVLVYNGEVYDHRRLRNVLADAGVRFRSATDTEVLLEAIARWGTRRALAESNGMWAFAVYDTHERRLTLATDRMGEKPLYVGWGARWLYFGSELKSLASHPGFAPGIDRHALAAFVRYGCVPAPHCIYERTWKLPPGTLLEVDVDGVTRPQWKPEAWWDLTEVAAEGIRRQGREDPVAVLERLEAALSDSVKIRMVADVPVGAFLSGGVDSSLVVALMREHATDVRTFSIGFSDPAYDEAPYAAAIARRLGTRHTELYVTPDDALGVVPRLPEVYDEPFADSSQIPTTMLAALTRRHVTVALSGDGGDELFSGYDRYRLQASLGRLQRHVPTGARQVAARGVTAVEPGQWDRLAARVRVLPFVPVPERLGDRLHKLAGILGSRSVEESYLRLMSAWHEPGEVVLGGCEPGTVLSDPSLWLPGATLTERLRHVDQLVYLPADILTKVDRAAMASSLETRIPLLDPGVIRLAWSVPPDLHAADRRGKYLLRALLGRRLPAHLFRRPKRGFAMPVGAWLRGPLRDWAEALLSPPRLAAEGFVDPVPVRRCWDEHQSGARDWTARLWTVLMWQAWYQRWCP